ncbi:hypothetical protein GCM10007285_16480 [Stappia taiwanensis]|nr:hypothetical protein GCM10007285_16480 [Stappia taiwanensis]
MRMSRVHHAQEIRRRAGVTSRAAAFCLALAGSVPVASSALAETPLPRAKPSADIARLVATSTITPAALMPAITAPAPVAPSQGGDKAQLLVVPLPVPAPQNRPPAGSLAPPVAREAAFKRPSRKAVAKTYFGARTTPAPLAARSIGSYAKGCLAGGRALAINGPSWQVMRLSRNRNWGHPELIDFLESLAADAPRLGWNGLLVGDLAQPRGGPMLSGHASHQIGLDADIWLTPMPDRVLTRQEREEISAVSMLKGPSNLKNADRGVDPAKWTASRARLIRRAASDPRVARIFVHPGIKQALCRFETGNRGWLRKVRPWWGHHYHFHVRMACPAGSAGCKDQNPPPPGDGCGKELAWWLSDEPWVPKKSKKPSKPAKKKRGLSLAALPNACMDVLMAR